jgi:hypothetical protein
MTKVGRLHPAQGQILRLLNLTHYPAFTVPPPPKFMPPGVTVVAVPFRKVAIAELLLEVPVYPCSSIVAPVNAVVAIPATPELPISFMLPEMLAQITSVPAPPPVVSSIPRLVLGSVGLTSKSLLLAVTLIALVLGLLASTNRPSSSVCTTVLPVIRAVSVPGALVPIAMPEDKSEPESVTDALPTVLLSIFP